MVTITFEDDEGSTFAHIRSTSGVLGHAKEVRDGIPEGVYLALEPKHARLTPWLVKKCGFRYVARVLHNHSVVEILRKEQ